MIMWIQQLIRCGIHMKRKILQERRSNAPRRWGMTISLRKQGARSRRSWHRAIVLVRRETAGDVEAIRAVTVAAFARPGEDIPGEAPLVDWLRASPAWIPELSLVAVEPSGDVVGHVVCTRGNVGSAPALALGPLSVRPEWWRQGVGKALVHAVLGAADVLDESLVALLGSTEY